MEKDPPSGRADTTVRRGDRHLDMRPLLSVIIPAYNCKDLLDESAGSVLSQLPDNCELIIVDDGSSDGTAEKLKELEGRQENLFICYEEHRGASGARNKGLDMARGEYVAFMDCDDCYREGFLSRSLPLTESGSDLYIFGIERVPLRGNNEYWTVKDGVYETAGAFADRYIRMRQLLVYSNCNKFYKREVIEREHLRFKENVDFGEDRLFNYAFLTACGRRESSGPCVTTSSMIMLRYIQRNEKSMSSCHKPGYFDCVMRLHQDKMDCFLTLSEDVTEEEKLDFEAYDFSREVEMTIERFADHPEEKDENLPLINRMIFGGPYDMDARVDVLVILGSRNCGYKVERALQIGRGNPEMKYIVSGGNPHKDGLHTEAEYMAEYLRVHGISDKQIYLENRAKYTKQNLLFSYGIIHELEVEADADSMASAPLRIGLITGGFHIRRTKPYADEIDAFAGEEVVYFPAYGPTTHIDTWFNDPVGRGVVLQELRKYLIAEKTKT